MLEVEIEYCVPCGHLDRAIDVQRMLLSELGNRLAGVRLRPGTGGVFQVRVNGELVLDAQQDGWDPDRVRDDVSARLAAA
jgi:selenoprotein W-related protein